MDMNSMASSGDPMGGYGMGVTPNMAASTSSNMMMNSNYGGPMVPPPNMGGAMMYPGNSRQVQKIPGHLTTVQMKLLSAQIKAYRCLARNMVLPDQLKAFIMSHAANVSGRTTPTATPPSQGVGSEGPAIQSPPQSKVTVGTSKVAPATSQPVAVTTAAASGGGQAANQSEDKAASGGGGTQLRPVKLTSINKPPGIDPEALLREKEAR